MTSAWAARWIDEWGGTRGTTDPATLCWFPREPAKLRAVSADGNFQSIIRCGFCSGCRELDRRRLATRLYEHFRSFKGDLWQVNANIPLTTQSSAMRRLRRSPIGRSFVGFYRLSASRIALLADTRSGSSAARRIARRFSLSWVKLRRSRGRRAFKELTAGMIQSRDCWGSWTNRYYHRGLTTLATDPFSVVTTNGLRKANPSSPVGVRAIRDGLRLVPPDAFRPPRLVRRKGPESLRVNRPISTFVGALQGIGGLSAMTGIRIAPAGGDQPRARLAASTVASGGRRPVRTFQSTKPDSLSGEGYRGSIHSSPRAAPFDFAAWGERMAEMAKNRSKPPPA